MCIFFLNFLVLIVIKLHAPIIIVIEQQGTRKPGSIPSACNYKISHLHQLKRDNSKLSYSISRVTLPGPQREYYPPPPPVFSPSFPFSPKPTKSKASPPPPKHSKSLRRVCSLAQNVRVIYLNQSHKTLLDNNAIAKMVCLPAHFLSFNSACIYRYQIKKHYPNFMSGLVYFNNLFFYDRFKKKKSVYISCHKTP